MAALWQVGLEARAVAFSLVFLTWVFVTLWVSIGASIHRNYEMPSPVCFFALLSPPFFTTDTARVSIGAGLDLITHANASPVNTSGCGWHCLLRCSLHPHCITGRRVVCRSLEGGCGPFFTSLRPINGLNTNGGRLR